MNDKVNYFELQRLAKFNREFIDIFETIERYLRRFVVFQSDDEPVIITNWIVHTWLIHLFELLSVVIKLSFIAFFLFLSEYPHEWYIWLGGR